MPAVALLPGGLPMPDSRSPITVTCLKRRRKLRRNMSVANAWKRAVPCCRFSVWERKRQANIFSLFLTHCSRTHLVHAYGTSVILYTVQCRDPINTRYAHAPLRFFAAPGSQCNILFIFSFSQEKQLSTTQTIKYEINIYLNLSYSISCYFSATFITI